MLNELDTETNRKVDIVGSLTKLEYVADAWCSDAQRERRFGECSISS